MGKLVKGKPTEGSKPTLYAMLLMSTGLLYKDKHMKETLKPGIKYEHNFLLPPSKTVPYLYPESEEFVAMPEVFATGFLVGFLEWSCIKAIKPHLDWPNEQTVGTHIDISHEAATPPGLEVTASIELVEVDGRKLVFSVEAHDDVDLISKGRHERFVINKAKFDAKVNEKKKVAHNE
ncbi:MAG: thioesterase family protein [Thiogranum sp.]